MDRVAMRAIGLMSGTSLDGVDAAWIETDGVTVSRIGAAMTLQYQDELRADLRRLLELAPELAPDDPWLREVERRLTLDHVMAVGMLGVAADVIGLHGQTILHAPGQGRNLSVGAAPRDEAFSAEPRNEVISAGPRTWQIGDAALLAARCGMPVVYDFRGADVAAGGQGAPLAPLFHAALAADLAKPLLVVNIGGVANMTWLGAAGEIIACDTGPGNGPLDDWVLRHTGAAFDRDGALAAQGLFRQDRLQMLLDDPYFARPAPKSLDRLHFSQLIEAAVAGLSPADGAATLTAFTVAAIARAPLPAPPLRVLVCGGGRKNDNMMARLGRAFEVPVQPVEAVGWDGDALEAQCFAFLAVRSRRGLPLSLPTTTGVPAPTSGGRLVG